MVLYSKCGCPKSILSGHLICQNCTENGHGPPVILNSASTYTVDFLGICMVALLL